MLRNDGVPEPKIEGLVTDLVNDTIYKCISRKLNVIYDATNLIRSKIIDLTEEFKYSADIDFRVFDISLKKAVERDSVRPTETKVGEHRLKEMFEDFKFLMDSFDFQPVKKVRNRPHVVPNFKSDLPECVVFDMDGTLALMGNRSPYDWEKVHHDDINHIVHEQLKFHKSLGRHIFIVTARDGAAKKLTEEWLELYGVEYDELLIKQKDDQRKDSITKKEIYDNNIKGKYNLICVYDDRLSVLDFWYKQGIFTFNVNQGNFEF
jgi:hypothetical protein